MVQVDRILFDQFNIVKFSPDHHLLNPHYTFGTACYNSRLRLLTRSPWRYISREKQLKTWIREQKAVTCRFWLIRSNSTYIHVGTPQESKKVNRPNVNDAKWIVGWNVLLTFRNIVHKLSIRETDCFQFGYVVFNLSAVLCWLLDSGNYI